ncbi:hypothetical protein BKA66DRAFT_4841 [Pyrenochaeta sp. MPI-SDFR-AT-0127]|nr:hypothetical protein BKA66DRAFT_4841 [Pyrenochaeta sp. MPI-SDFR-AT-0127]
MEIKNLSLRLACSPVHASASAPGRGRSSDRRRKICYPMPYTGSKRSICRGRWLRQSSCKIVCHTIATPRLLQSQLYQKSAVSGWWTVAVLLLQIYTGALTTQSRSGRRSDDSKANERPSRLDSVRRGGQTRRTVGLPLNDRLPDQRRHHLELTDRTKCRTLALVVAEDGTMPVNWVSSLNKPLAMRALCNHHDAAAASNTQSRTLSVEPRTYGS